MNILLIIPYGGIGGIERLAVTLYAQYKALGHNVLVVKVVQKVADIVNFGADERCLSHLDFWEMAPRTRLAFYARAPKMLSSIIIENEITHSIALGDLPNLISSLSRTSEFKVASIHSVKSIELKRRSFLNTIFRIAYRTTYRRFNQVVCISEAIAADLRNNLRIAFSSKMRVIYNPHDIENITMMAREPLSVQHLDFFKDDTVIFIGRIAGVKGLEHLIRSFALLSAHSNTCNLAIIGDGDANLVRKLKKLSKEMGMQSRISFLSSQKNPYKFLRRAKVLALSSYYEGTPNVIAEAIALGVPIVSTNSTLGIQEMMALDEPESMGELLVTEAGIITPTFFSDAKQDTTHLESIYCSALRLALYDPIYEHRIRASRVDLLEKFDARRAALSYLNAI